MKNSKMKKVVALVAVFALIVMLIPMAALADNVGVTASPITAEVPTIKTTGTIAGSGDITFLAIRSTASLNGNIPDPLDEDAIMYVDQKKADTNGQATWTFELRDTAADGRWITVFMGTSDANYGCAEVELKESPGTIERVDNGKTYYINGEQQALNLSGAVQGWLDDVTIGVYDGETLVGSVNKETGVIDVDPASDEAKEYTIKFTDVDGYNSVGDMTVSVISADGAKLVEFDGVPKLNDSGENVWTVTVPAGTADVTVTVKVFIGNDSAGADVTADVTAGVLTVERAGEGGDAKTVVVTATAGSASKILKRFTIEPKGPVAPAISAENVTIIANKAYGQSGKTLITVTVGSTVVNPEAASMTVGDAKLYYSPDKEKYYGVVDASLATDATTLAGNIDVDVATASEKLYFGVILASNTGTKMNGRDFGFAGRTTLGKESPTDKQYIAMDVYSAEPDGKFTGQDFGALGRHSLGADLPVLAK